MQDEAVPHDDAPDDRILAAVARRADANPDLLVEFARGAIRRVPGALLARTNRDVAADWMHDAFTWFHDTPADHLSVRLHNPEVALDGRSTPGTIVEVAGVDRPFLLSTVSRTIEHVGESILRHVHPIYGTQRDADGHLVALTPARDAERRETFMHLELDRRLDDDRIAELQGRLEAALTDVMRVTDDHHAMRERVAEVAERLRTDPPVGIDPAEANEVAALFDWLLDDNFVLLGFREYDVVHEGESPHSVAVDTSSGLGLLRDPDQSRFADGVAVESLTGEQQQRLRDAPLLLLSRTTRLSTVHRLQRMQYVGVLWRDADGRAIRESRLIGLFTASGVSEPASTTPVLRSRLEAYLAAEDIVRGSHDEATLVGLFQTLPKDELFEADAEHLSATMAALLDAEERRRIRVVTRVDRAARTVSVILAIPRDDYSATVRRRITAMLTERFGASAVDVDLSLGDHVEAVARFTVHVVRGEIPNIPAEALEREILSLARPWLDTMRANLIEQFGEQDGRRLTSDVARRLPQGYRDRNAPDDIARDVAELDVLLSGGEVRHVWIQSAQAGLHVKAAQRNDPIPLSDFLPMLESLGLRVLAEHPDELEGDGPAVFLHDFEVQPHVGIDDTSGVRELAADALVAAAAGHLEVDNLNRLILGAGLSWHEVAVLRAYRRYRRQVGTSLSSSYTNDAMFENPEATRLVMAYFRARFDPDLDASHEDIEAARAAALAACDAIVRLDHDRVVRGMLTLVDATLRTTAFRDDNWAEDAQGRSVPVLAFKFDSSIVPDMPRPVPYREIFVASPAVEGIHLRGGPIARGGLRWSDRLDDVRTEVLGLMKAQVLKNALIVPDGAKGGFVLKRPPTDPAALRDDVQRQYTTFIRALLDLTDDIRDGEVVPPTRVRRHDDDDPYLVVAADKGTATFSDVANGVAAERGFWLGDAFASGGSAGYDHKALAITARGAWVAVTRHFRELGVDLQEDPVQVAGVGDMSGDVFGNGMLLSRSIRLVAAFDHRDIFIDPEPDPATSFAERQRLFDLPRSSWQDYDRTLISEGGFVISRAAKRVDLSPEARKVLGTTQDSLTPAEVIRAILRAPVDLLYFGGIGTYVKASDETHADVGDRVNDEVRVDGTEVRARVLGEGANLAITQRGRIQYARRGGRVDQDAMHNAAGVDISDHEVNVKILLREAIDRGRLAPEDRDALLERVTDDVVQHVLSDIDRQMGQISNATAHSASDLEAVETTLVALEDRGLVDRHVDVLPSTDEIAERAEVGAGLTRPELATLQAAAKRALTRDILGSSLAHDPLVVPIARTYFPPQLVADFGDLIPAHRLHPELVATLVANDLIDRLGPTWVFRVADETGHATPQVVAAAWTAREVVDGGTLFAQLDSLAGMVTEERLRGLSSALASMLERLTRRYLPQVHHADVHHLIQRDRGTVGRVREALPRLGTTGQQRARLATARRLMDDLVDDELAMVVSSVLELSMVPDASALARRLRTREATSDVHTADVIDAMLRLSDRLGLNRLQELIASTAVAPGWDRRQLLGLETDAVRLQRDAVAEGIARAGGYADAVEAFVAAAGERADHARTLLAEVEAIDAPPPSAVAVVARTYRELVDAVVDG